MTPPFGVVVDLDFAGGTLAEYFEVVSRLGQANLVVPANASAVSMPPVRLSGVSLHDAILLPNAVTREVRVSAMGGGDYVLPDGRTASARPYYAVEVHAAMAGEGTDGPATIEVDFPGGTAVAYIEAVQEAAGAAQVVAMPGVESFTMPATRLRGVELGDAIRVLESAVEGDGSSGRQLLVSSPTGPRSIPARAGMGRQDGVAAPVYVVRVSRSVGAPSSVSTRVWSLSELLAGSGFNADDILTAVEAALSLEGSTPGNMRYHEQTRLLIVRGDESALVTVEGVLDGLSESSRALGVVSERDAQLAYEVRVAELEAEHWERRIAQLERELEAARQLVEKGAAPEKEAELIKSALADVRAQAEVSRLKIEQARLKLETFREAPERE